MSSTAGRAAGSGFSSSRHKLESGSGTPMSVGGGIKARVSLANKTSTAVP